MSCGDLDSTVQGSCPHKWGQDVSCGHLMGRWQLSPRIAPPPCSHGWPTVLVLFLFGAPREAVFKGVPLFPSVTLVCQGQDCPRQHLLTVWTFFVRPRTFLPPRRGPWAWYEMGRGCQILWPHNSPSKSCCPAPRAGMRILMSSGLCHGQSSFVPRECQSLFTCPRHAPGVSIYETRRH